MTESFKVGKPEAARRQLETAVRLYFNEADPLSIHTLTAASHRMLRDLTSQTNTHRPTFLEQSVAALPQNLRARIYREECESQNFLKHADRDPDGFLEFAPGLTEWMLIDAIGKYTALTGDERQIFRAYGEWFFARLHPELLEVISSSALFQQTDKEICRMSRKEFLLSRLNSNSAVLM